VSTLKDISLTSLTFATGIVNGKTI